jgi:hypothetical protein
MNGRHNYGTDQIFQAIWNIKKMKKARENALLDAIQGRASKGQAHGLEPGTKGYELLEKFGGPGYAQDTVAMQQKAAAQNELEGAVQKYTLANNFFNTAINLQEKIGVDKKVSGPMVKEFLGKAGALYKSLGINADLNSAYDASVLKENKKTAEKSRIGTMMNDLNPASKSYANDIDRARVSANIFLGNNSGEKEFVSSVLATLDDKEQKRQFNIKESRLRRKDTGEKVDTPTKIQARILNKYLKNEKLSSAEDRILKKFFKGSGRTPEEIDAAVRAEILSRANLLAEKQGAPISKEQWWKLIANDPFGMAAPPEAMGAGGLPKGLTEEDVAHYKKEFNWDRAEVIRRFKAKNR